MAIELPPLSVQKKKRLLELTFLQVRSTQTISTYALPPTTRFSCAPTSSFTRAVKKSFSFSRRTYAAVSAPRKQLLCWEEYGVSSNDDKAETINLLSRNESRQDIVYLQDLSVGRKRSAEGGLLAVYADGYIRCFSSDLKEEKWEFSPPSVDAGKKDCKVVYTASTTLAMAKKALFKNRMDVVLPESMPEDDTPEDTVLFTVSRRESAFEARVFAIPAANEDSKAPRELLVLNLPGSASEKGDDASGTSVFSVHFPTATLHFLSAEKLTTYSLTSTVPSVSSSLRLTSGSPTDPSLSSLLRVAPTTVLVATPEHVSLYDTKFTSLQARVPIQLASTTGSTPVVSRSSTPAPTAGGKVQGGVFLTEYLSELDLAIGYSQNGIVAIQLSRGSKEVGRKGGLLIDSLCRGVDGLEIPTVDDGKTQKVTGGAAMKKIISKLSLEKTRLAATMVKLRKARRKDNLEKFESAFAEYVGIKITVPQAPAAQEDIAMTNGISLEASKKQLPEFTSNPANGRPLSHEFVTAVLAHIFTPSTSADGDAILTISFYPPNVIKHLAESGNLSSMLLPRNTTSTLVSSIITFDPSLRTLEWALSTITAISAPEIVFAVAAALAQKTPDDNAAAEDDDLALKVIRSEVLRLALIRLDSFPESTVIASIKSGLSGESLMALISLLRRELSVHDTGYPHMRGEIGVGIGDMGIVSSLLTTMLDSIGIGGLVLVDDADGLIAGLHEEVGDAVDAIEEAAGLKGILEEMFRHADWRRVAIERREGEKNERTPKENTERKKEKAERKKEGIKGRRKRLAIREKKADADAEQSGVMVLAEQKGTAISKSAVKKSGTARRSHKARIARADQVSRTAHVARLETRRKPQHRRQGRETQGNSISALLPLGLAPPPPSAIPGTGLTLRGLVGTGMGAEVEKRELERKRGREANYRKSLVAGVYSVESIVV